MSTHHLQPTHRHLARLLPIVLSLTLVAAACQTTGQRQGSPAPSSPRAAASGPATPEPTAVTAAAPSPTVTPSPTATARPTATPRPTSTPTPKPTPKPTEKATQVGQGTSGPGGQDPRWARAIHTGDGGVVGVVTTASLNIRSSPRLTASVVETTYQRHTVTVYDHVAGDAVGGDSTWYRIGQGQYVAAAYVAPFVAPAPARTFGGHWVDVNLTQFYAVAYDGTKPVYAAIITAGRRGGDSATPTGVFQVFSRVRNETMDSATVGIPKGDPHYYYLTNVQYTQYFKADGYALHQNYWTPPDQFGNYSTNGCVGLLLPDAAWFWSYLSTGSTVSIHQ